jgi:hypothetical protein
MIIYNVTIKVENQIADEWLEWMKQEHIPELMDTGLFADARLSRLLEQDETEGITYIAQYFCKDMEAYRSYISDHSERMRNKSFARFGNRFIAFRTLMQVEN